MTNYWTTGKLAEFAGLSIRTLRYYDQIGLFSPSAYTESGHRRYTNVDLQRLLQILVLKQMGLPLDEIKEVLTTKEHSIVSTIDQQIDRIKLNIDAQQKLLSQLENTRQEVSYKEDISFEGLTSLFELIRLNRSNYFTNEQLNELRNNYLSTSEEVLKKGEKEFKEVLAELQDKKEKGISPTNQSVKNLARKWKDLACSFSNGDHQLEEKAKQFYADNPNHALHYGLNGSLYAYIQEALNDITK